MSERKKSLRKQKIGKFPHILKCVKLSNSLEIRRKILPTFNSYVRLGIFFKGKDILGYI